MGASKSHLPANILDQMSHSMRKKTSCIGKNKGADQLCSDCTANQHLHFRYTESTIPLLLINRISSFKPASMIVHADLCQTWSKTQEVTQSNLKPQTHNSVYHFTIKWLLPTKNNIRQRMAVVNNQ